MAVKAVAAVAACAVAAAYFVAMIGVIPQLYLEYYTAYPTLTHHVSVSDSNIPLGESFSLRIDVDNEYDQADILITSVSFPSLEGNLEDHVRLVRYDFGMAPLYLEAGDAAGVVYGAGSAEIVHPTIRSTGVDVAAGDKHHVEFLITPPTEGDFEMQIKTTAVPHSHSKAHYPHSGFVDTQGEFVEIHVVGVFG